MLFLDMPNVAPQNVPVMIAQANQATLDDVKTTRTIGVCFPAPNDNYSLENVLSPINSAGFYLRSYELQKVADTDPATITILQQPAHGTLRLVTETDGNSFGEGRFDPASKLYVYLPKEGYLGKDSATALVEIGGIKVKVVYFFQAIEGPLGNTGIEDHCGKTGYRWKISSASSSAGSAYGLNQSNLAFERDSATAWLRPSTLRWA